VSKQAFPTFLRGEKEELLTYLLTFCRLKALENFETLRHTLAGGILLEAFPSCSSANEGLVTCFSLTVGFKDFWGFPPMEEVSK